MSRALVIGARRARQGIGAFIAGALAAAGARVEAIVGTREETVMRARELLYDDFGIACRGYTSVERALREEEPDVVAICSPTPFHRRHLERVGEAGAHALAEKPLWWKAGLDLERETARLVDAFIGRERYLRTVTQWPFTLPAFHRLHPETRGGPVARFEMWLSPIIGGTRMVLDSAPHVLSMLETLSGRGEVESARAVFLDDRRSRLELEFVYRGERGTTEVACRFETRKEPPRPAGYALDGHAVEREIELPSYRMRFVGGGRSTEVEDPLPLCVRDFLEKAEAGAPVDREGLLSAMRGLGRLQAAAEEAGSRSGS